MTQEEILRLAMSSGKRLIVKINSRRLNLSRQPYPMTDKKKPALPTRASKGRKAGSVQRLNLQTT